MTLNSKRDAQHRAMAELERLQADLEDRWVNGSLPDDWSGLFADEEVRPDKTKITLRLDADMVRWFRKMGPNYGRLMNRVLRVYWTSLLAGHIKAYYAHDTTPQIMVATRRMLDDGQR